MNQNDKEKLNEIKKDPDYDGFFFELLDQMCKDQPNDMSLGATIRAIFQDRERNYLHG